MALGIGEVIEKARSDLHKLTGLEISTTVKYGKRWRWVGGEHWSRKKNTTIPDSMDILATYETRLDLERK